MRKAGTLALVVVLSGLVYCGCGGSSKSSLAELEGAWVGQELMGVPGECRMTVAGDQMKFQGAMTNEWYTALLTLNPATDPKQAIVQIKECGFPQFANKSAHAIYKLEKNTLTIAAGEPGVDATPSGFLRSATNRIRCFVFTKQ